MVQAASLAYDGSVASGGTVSFGFQAAFSGSNDIPADFAVNGVACNGGSPSPSPSPTGTPSPSPSVTTTGPPCNATVAAGMKVTHPHLVGFVNIIDSVGLPAEGGAAALARMVYSFAAAGVANPVVAIADNDTAAYTALEKVKNDPKLPARFKILHYPDLPLLEQYPTLGPYEPEPVPANVNGTAGALEMYFGRDVLTNEGSLAPVQWTSWDSKAYRYQGSLLPGDKRRVQQAFRDKVAAEERGEGAGADWTGIKAIIDRIIGAVD